MHSAQFDCHTDAKVSQEFDQIEIVPRVDVSREHFWFSPARHSAHQHSATNVPRSSKNTERVDENYQRHYQTHFHVAFRLGLTVRVCNINT
jgi:hypothetical protein